MKNSLENNNKKDKVGNNKENSIIQQSINNIVGLDLKKVEQKAKQKIRRKEKKKQKKQKESYANNITTVQANNNEIENLTQNKNEIITQNNSINNIEDKKEDHNKNKIILDSNNINNIENENINNGQIIEQYNIENDYEPQMNINNLRNNLSSNSINLNNNTNYFNNISHNNYNIDNLTVITERTEADEINKNKMKKLRRKANKQKKDKEFYDLFKEFDNQSEVEQNKNDDKVNNNKIIEELETMKQQIITENNGYSIDEVKNTSNNYITILRENNDILKSLLFEYNIEKSNTLDKIYYLYIISEIIEIKTYNDTLYKYCNKFKNMKLLKFNMGSSILNINNNDSKFMVKKLYFNVFKNKLFIDENINFNKEIKNELINKNNLLVKFFKPLTIHNEKVTEILNNWEKKICNEKILTNLTDEDKRNLLIEEYAKYFLKKIKIQYNQQNILKQKVDTEYTQKIINTFTKQIISIINIIQKHEFNDYKQLMDSLSKEIEEKLISEYLLFRKMNGSSYKYNEEVSEEIFKKFIDCVNKTKNTSEIDRAVQLRSIISNYSIIRWI